MTCAKEVSAGDFCLNSHQSDSASRARPSTSDDALIQGPQALAAVRHHLLALLALGILVTALPIVLFMNILRQADLNRIVIAR